MNLLRMLGNASANVARIVINAIAAVLLPRILLGTLTPEEYSVWVLIVQISLYSGYLDVGFSTVVGRMVAQLKEKGDQQRLSAIVSSGIALMVGLALLACMGILVAVSAFDRIFPDIPAQLHQQATLALLVVGIVTAFRLPFWILSGVFIGLQRNEFPLAYNLVNRTVVLVACWLVAQQGGGLLAVAIAYSLATVATSAAELIAYVWYVPKIRVSFRAIQRSALREIGSNSVGFGVWQVSILLVSGLDLLIVGKWDFARVAAYSFSITLVSFVRQVQSSSVSVAMPVAAVLMGRDDQKRLDDLLMSSTRLGALLLYLGGLPLIAAGTLVISLWVGPKWVAETVPLLTMLLVATILRQSTLSFSMVVVGVGRQNQVLLSPLLGAVINLAISIAGTIRFGAIGAALGTLVGGIFEVTMHIFYNLPRIRELTVRSRQYFVAGWLVPFGAMLPAIALTAGWRLYGDPVNHPFATGIVGMVVALLVIVAGWFFVLGPANRARVQRMLREVRGRLLPHTPASSEQM